MKKIGFFLLGMFLASGAFSQSISSYVITSTGGAIMGPEGALYISIGEPMSTEITDGEVMISQGFLNVAVQGMPVDTDDLMTEVIRAYPNPTVAEVMIDLPEMDGSYFYQLTSVEGRLISHKQLTTSKTIVPMQDAAAGSYYLRIIKDDKQSRTLKITKL